MQDEMQDGFSEMCQPRGKMEQGKRDSNSKEKMPENRLFCGF
jgi:hypothetical protein